MPLQEFCTFFKQADESILPLILLSFTSPTSKILDKAHFVIYVMAQKFS